MRKCDIKLTYKYLISPNSDKVAFNSQDKNCFNLLLEFITNLRNCEPVSVVGGKTAHIFPSTDLQNLILDGYFDLTCLST